MNVSEGLQDQCNQPVASASVMCIEVEERDWDEVGSFAGRCLGWRDAKCGGLWWASAWVGKAAPVPGPYVLLERVQHSHRSEDSMIVTLAELVRVGDLEDPTLSFCPQRWVKSCRLERWMSVPGSRTLVRREEVELECQERFVAAELCGPETAARWKAERRVDKKPTLNEVMGGRNLRRCVGPLSREEMALRDHLNNSLLGKKRHIRF